MFLDAAVELTSMLHWPNLPPLYEGEVVESVDPVPNWLLATYHQNGGTKGGRKGTLAKSSKKLATGAALQTTKQ